MKLLRSNIVRGSSDDLRSQGTGIYENFRLYGCPDRVTLPCRERHDCGVHECRNGSSTSPTGCSRDSQPIVSTSSSIEPTQSGGTCVRQYRAATLLHQSTNAIAKCDLVDARCADATDSDECPADSDECPADSIFIHDGPTDSCDLAAAALTMIPARPFVEGHVEAPVNRS